MVALGLGGYEAPHPPDEFAPWFERAGGRCFTLFPTREKQVALTACGALYEAGCGAPRHGVRSIEDPALGGVLGREQRHAHRGVPHQRHAAGRPRHRAPSHAPPL